MTRSCALHSWMSRTLLLLLSTLISVTSFIATTTPSCHRYCPPSALFEKRSLSTTSVSESTTSSPSTNNPHHLTPELLKLARAFENIGDDKLRYKQLLYMANQLPALPEHLKTPDNQVPGCLSTVHVHARFVGNDNDNLVEFQGDSDGLLTKGLLALLIRGLNGNRVDEIAAVQPEFIQTAGIAASLTPGRNNGFLNMLAVMKQKARDLKITPKAETNQNDKVEEKSAASEDAAVDDDRPMYHAILKSLEQLKPTRIQLDDVSYQHAGHAHNDRDGESHFELYIVASAFEGLNLIKRHKLVYMMLGDVMPKIHALQIRAQTPQEAERYETK